jgi:uncharacterized protein
MTELNGSAELAERYMTVWNESDSQARRAAVAQIWSEDARCCTPNGNYVGLEAIEGRVAAAYDKWVAQEGFVFRARAGIDEHHAGMRVRWDMVPSAGGEAVSSGAQFLLLDDDGRVRYDYQFMDS